MNEKLFNNLLNFYSLSRDDYFELTKTSGYELFDFIKNYQVFNDTKKLIKEAIKNNRKILIYGDYDCDGILATSILFLTLKTESYKPGFYIPFRNKDGYGINKDKINEFLSLGYDFFILVDNGITLIEEVKMIKEANANCVIIDHHSIQDELPNADYIIHYSFFKELKDNISAGALSFIFSIAYKETIDPYLLALGSLTIFSDLMPQKNLNHQFSKLGLKAINDYKFHSICALIGKDKNITSDDIYYSFIPKVNSIGRIVENNNLFAIVKYFVEEENNEKYLNFIDKVNEERRQLISSFDKENYKVELEKDVIVIKSNLHEGIIGLIANKLMEEYNKPCFIFTKDKNGNLKGSGRSKNGYDLINFLDKNKTIFLTHGGHSFACGVSIKEADFEKFSSLANLYYQTHPFIKKIKCIEINREDINSDTYDLIQSFAPFGKELEKPLLCLKDVSSNSLLFSKDHKHIITKIDYSSSLVYFNYPDELLSYTKIDLFGYLDKNIFNTKITYQLKCSDFEKSSSIKN